MDDRKQAAGNPALAFAFLITGTILGLAGTDLVLPAVPSLPGLLGGTPAQAQLVLATYTAGSALGLLVFGALGARFDQRHLLIGSLVAYGLMSLSAAWSRSARSADRAALFAGRRRICGGRLRAWHAPHALWR